MADVPTLLSRLAPLPPADFSAYGETTTVNLSRIQKLTGAFLGRNWVTIPHVTHHDEVDVGDTERRRAAWNAAHAGQKLTILTPVVKALVSALKLFPYFNASLSEHGNNLILKKYFNIGIAVETAQGLLVPVVIGCDTKSSSEIGAEINRLAEKAKSKGLSMAEMSGSSMAISSLGHVGGIAFTPIINAPDVAILGMTRIQERPVRGPDDIIEWRKMLPISLSYDHRVINGADAARFVRYIGEALQSPALFED